MMNDKNRKMCFTSVFHISSRVAREHSEAVLTVFSSSNNILLSKVVLADLKLLQDRLEPLEFLGL